MVVYLQFQFSLVFPFFILLMYFFSLQFPQLPGCRSPHCHLPLSFSLSHLPPLPAAPLPHQTSSLSSCADCSPFNGCLDLILSSPCFSMSNKYYFTLQLESSSLWNPGTVGTPTNNQQYSDLACENCCQYEQFKKSVKKKKHHLVQRWAILDLFCRV